MAAAEGLEAKIALVVNALGAQERAILAKKLTPAIHAGANNAIIDGIYHSTLEAMVNLGELSKNARSLQEHFFETIVDFIIPVSPNKKAVARISANSLDAIWTWYTRDVAQTDAIQTAVALLNAQLQRDQRLCGEIVNDFRARFVEFVSLELIKIQKDEISYNRFRGVLGGEVIVRDLIDVVAIFENIEAVGFIKKLIIEYRGNQNGVIEDSFIASVRKYILSVTENFSFLSAVTAQLMFVYNDNVQNLIRFVFPAKQEIVTTSQILNNQFLPCLELILSELEILSVKLKQSLRDSADVHILVSIFKKYYLTAKMLNTEIEFLSTDHIGSQFIQIRKEFTDIAKGELSDLMPMVTRSIRHMRPRKGDHIQLPDEDVISRIDYMLKLFDGIRHMGGELALNDFFAQIKANLEKLLDHTFNHMLTEPIPAGDDALELYSSISEILLQFATPIMGEEAVKPIRKNFRAIISSRIAQSSGIAS